MTSKVCTPKHKDHLVKNLNDKERVAKSLNEMDEFDLSFHVGSLAYRRMWFTIAAIASGVLITLVATFGGNYLPSDTTTYALLVALGVAFLISGVSVYRASKEIAKADVFEEKLKSDRWESVKNITSEEEELFVEQLSNCPTCGSTLKYRSKVNS